MGGIEPDHGTLRHRVKSIIRWASHRIVNALIEGVLILAALYLIPKETWVALLARVAIPASVHQVDEVDKRLAAIEEGLTFYSGDVELPASFSTSCSNYTNPGEDGIPGTAIHYRALLPTKFKKLISLSVYQTDSQKATMKRRLGGPIKDIRLIGYEAYLDAFCFGIEFKGQPCLQDLPSKIVEGMRVSWTAVGIADKANLQYDKNYIGYDPDIKRYHAIGSAGSDSIDHFPKETFCTRSDRP